MDGSTPNALSRRPVLRKLLIGLAIAAISFSVALFISRLGLFITMEWKIYDLEFRTFRDHPDRANEDIVMVKIDDLSVDRMAENDFGRFPWPRDTYAVLLDYLARAGPKAVAFDILFLEEDKSTVGDRSGAEADAELVTATRKLGHVIHAIEANDTTPLPADKWPPALQFKLPATVEAHSSVKLPFSSLAESSGTLGHTFVVYDQDGPIRRAVPFVRQGNAFYPSLAL